MADSQSPDNQDSDSDFDLSLVEHLNTQTLFALDGLDGSRLPLEACRLIYYGHEPLADDDPDLYNFFRGVESNTEDWLVGAEEREVASKEQLSLEDARISRYMKKYGESIEQHLRKVVERYAPEELDWLDEDDDESED